MAFWALEVVPGKEFTAQPPFDLHLTQVVLPANAADNGRSVLQAKVDDKQFAIASLKLNMQENISLDLIFEAGKTIDFTVSGKNPVQLLGYYIDNQGGGMSDDELDGESFGDFDDEEVDSEGDEDDDEDDEDEDDVSLDLDQEIDQATLKKLQQKRKAELQQETNGAKKPKVDQQKPQQQQQPQQKGGQQKGAQQQPQQKQAQPQKAAQQPQKEAQQPQKEAQQQKGGQQQKGQQQQRPQTPGKEQQQQKPQTPGNKEQQQKGGQTPQQKEVNEGKTKFVNGVKIETTTIGLGSQVQLGKKAFVMYTGRLESNGKVFDKSQKPFSFRIGAGEVIKGWDVGVNGMRVGEKRKLTIPPQLAYGPGGAPPDIPPNATLVFDVELVRV